MMKTGYAILNHANCETSGEHTRIKSPPLPLLLPLLPFLLSSAPPPPFLTPSLSLLFAVPLNVYPHSLPLPFLSSAPYPCPSSPLRPFLPSSAVLPSSCHSSASSPSPYYICDNFPSSLLCLSLGLPSSVTLLPSFSAIPSSSLLFLRLRLPLRPASYAPTSPPPYHVHPTPGLSFVC